MLSTSLTISFEIFQPGSFHQCVWIPAKAHYLLVSSGIIHPPSSHRERAISFRITQFIAMIMRRRHWIEYFTRRTKKQRFVIQKHIGNLGHTNTTYCSLLVSATDTLIRVFFWNSWLVNSKTIKCCTKVAPTAFTQTRQLNDILPSSQFSLLFF